MKRLILPFPPEQDVPLKELAFALITALAVYFPLSGKMEVTYHGEEESLSYQNADQAQALLKACKDIHLISVQDHHFSMLLDRTSMGIEVDYVPLDPSNTDIYQEIQILCARIHAQLRENPEP